MFIMFVRLQSYKKIWKQTKETAEKEMLLCPCTYNIGTKSIRERGFSVKDYYKMIIMV